MPEARAAILIVADDREEEREVVAYLRALPDVVVEVRRLSVGDFVLSQRLAVEFKTAADFIASILDRRLFAQVAQLKVAYARVVFMVAGPSLYGLRPVHPNAIRGALSYLLVWEDVAVLRAESSEDAALLLATMARQEQQGLRSEISTFPKRRSRSPALQIRYVVEALPGIGPHTAQAMLEHFGSLRALLNASPDELRRVPGVGPIRARHIEDLLTSPYPPPEEDQQ